MADMNLVADVKIGKVDVANLTAALNAEFNKISSSAMGTVSGGGGGGSKDISQSGDVLIGALRTVFGSTLDDLLKVVSNIAQVLLPFVLLVSGVFASLAALPLLLKITADFISAFWNGFRTIARVWNMIMELVSKIVELFSILLLPVLMPILTVLGIMARLVAMVIMPIFVVLMKMVQQMMQGQMSNFYAKIMSGDFAGAFQILIDILTPVVELLMAKLKELADFLMPKVMKLVNDFVTINMDSVKNTLQNLLGKDLGDVAFKLINSIYFAISAIMGFVASFAGRPEDLFSPEDQATIQQARFDALNEALANGKSVTYAWAKGVEASRAKMAEINPGVAFGANVADTIKGLIAAVESLVKGITDFVFELTGINDSVDNADYSTILGINLPAWIEAKKTELSNIITEDIIPAINTFIEKVEAARTFIFGEDGKGGKIKEWTGSIDNLVKAIDAWTKNINDFPTPGKFFRQCLQDAANRIAAGVMSNPSTANTAGGTFFGPLLAGISANEQMHPYGYGDFIMRPGSAPISFSPDDTIIGTKGGIGGGTTNNFTIIVNGNGERFIADSVKTGIEDFFSNASRSGYFQKGY